jgi:hypothetical protein
MAPSQRLSPCTAPSSARIIAGDPNSGPRGVAITTPACRSSRNSVVSRGPGSLPLSVNEPTRGSIPRCRATPRPGRSGAVASSWWGDSASSPGAGGVGSATKRTHAAHPHRVGRFSLSLHCGRIPALVAQRQRRQSEMLVTCAFESRRGHLIMEEPAGYGHAVGSGVQDHSCRGFESHLLRARPCSSTEERLPYKQRVGGSSPSAGTAPTADGVRFVAMRTFSFRGEARSAHGEC